MSTPRWKAKPNSKKYPYAFELEDGRKFRRFNNKLDRYDKNTKFYLSKPIGNCKYDEYTYWVYPIPYRMAFYHYGEYGDKHLMWRVLIEAKKKK